MNILVLTTMVKIKTRDLFSGTDDELLLKVSHEYEVVEVVENTHWELLPDEANGKGVNGQTLMNILPLTSILCGQTNESSHFIEFAFVEL